MASSWYDNWQSWKKFSFVSSAFYTPPVRRAGVPGLPQRNQGRENAPQLIQRCHKVPLGQRNICTLAPFKYCHTSCLLSCPSELSWCIGQATWENPKAFWVSNIYFIFISAFSLRSKQWLLYPKYVAQYPDVPNNCHQTETISFAPNNNFLQTPTGMEEAVLQQILYNV